MRRSYRWFGLLALPSVLAGCGDAIEPGSGQPWADGDGLALDPEGWGRESPDDASEAWFVELESAPIIRGGSPDAIRSERAEFHRRASRAGVRYHRRLTFGRLWNGISVRVDREDLGKLREMEGVKAIYPVLTVERDEVQQGDDSGPDLAYALSMTGADVAHNALGLTGEGIKVGVIDSGTDFDNPDLGGCFGIGCKVSYGHDFVGDAYDSNSANASYFPYPQPDNIPDDCGGHGTHVSGIVAAKGAVVGVAPDVTLGAYRVFGCTGSTSTDIMASAMERASEDGMRVINMSIGSPFTWPGYPSAVAATNLVDDGVVVVTSTGNSGADGLYAAGSPGLGAKVIATAAFENTHIFLSNFEVGADKVRIGYLQGANTPAVAIPTTGGAELARTGTTASTNDACTGATAPAAGSLTGKIALIRRGGCPFFEKATNAQAAGAIAVILYNNATGFVTPNVAGTPPVTIPVVGTSDGFGATLDARIAQGSTSLAWLAGESVFVNPIAGQLASFSSYGPAADLTLKPDIGAPGGNIYSTYPLELGGHTTISGTSMAAPHVTGLVALLMQARPELTATEMRTALQNSAEPIVQLGQQHADYTFRQGAGIARINDAAVETVMVSPSKLGIGESQAGPFVQTLTLTNATGTSEVVFDLSHRPSLSVTGTTLLPTVSTAGFATVAFSAPSVTVPAGGQATVDVTITPASLAVLPQNGLFGGYIVLTQQGGGRTLSVPYAGFSGDYQAITAISLKQLRKVVNGALATQANGAKYTMKSGDLPYITLRYAHHVTQVKLDAFAVVDPTDPNYLTKLKAQGNVLTLDLVGRHQLSTSLSNYSWNGTTRNGKSTYTVPNGYYVIKLSALKALGNPANPAHWETWTSPIITISRT